MVYHLKLKEDAIYEIVCKGPALEDKVPKTGYCSVCLTNVFLRPPSHLYAVTCITEISLIMT